MFSFKLISGLVYPYIFFFIVAGIFFLFYFKFLQLRFLLLSFKILSGALDWKGSKGKITPGRAFFSGVLGSFFPGFFVGLFLAIAISGPGIILVLCLIHFLQASIEFVLSSVSFKFRIRNPNGNLETGLILGIERYSRVRWLGIIYAIFFILLSLFHGTWNLSFISSLSNHSQFNIPFFLDATNIMIFFIIFLILIFNGGIKRIGLYSKIVSYTMIIILLILGLSIQNSIKFLPDIFDKFYLLFHKSNLKTTFFSIFIYSIFSEVPSPRLNIFSGFVRTDHAAKQGIATIIYPLIQVLLIFLTFGTFYEFILNNNIKITEIKHIHDFLNNIQNYWLNQILFSHDNTYINIVLYILLLLLIFSSFLSWFYTGNMIFRQFALRFKFTNFYPIISVFLYIFFIFFLTNELNVYNKIYFYLFIFISGIVLILTILFSLIYHNLGKFELSKYMESYEGGIDISRDLFVLLFTILPSNFISKLFGYFSLIKFPKPIMIQIIKLFSKIYKINLQEVKGELKHFKNLNEFFIRELKEDVRPIDKRKYTIVSPVDALLSRRGIIKDGLLIQAKGINYTLKDLIGDPEYIPYFEGGRYCVLYLSPQDYHRIHVPFDCEVEGYTYEPGHLFPVNKPAVEGLYGLFPKNERLTTFLKTKYGRIAMIKVGATNVGKICVVYDSLKTNTWIRRKKAIKYNHKIIFNKGQEIARFEMGSTVILLFEKHKVEFLDTALEGTKVKLGTAIAYFKQ